LCELQLFKGSRALFEKDLDAKKLKRDENENFSEFFFFSLFKQKKIRKKLKKFLEPKSA